MQGRKWRIRRTLCDRDFKGLCGPRNLREKKERTVYQQFETVESVGRHSTNNHG